MGRRVFRFGFYEADLANARLTRKGMRVRLQEQPFRVLGLLLERAGEIVTREQLREQLWPAGTHVDFEGSLNAALKRLRAALGDRAENPRFVETVPKRGYRFIAPVEAVVLPPEPAAAAPAAEPPSVRRRGWMAWSGLGLVVIAVGLGLAFRAHSGGRPRASLAMRRSVAVLGFENASGRSEDAWLGTALAEMLRTELGLGGEVRIVAGEEVAQSLAPLGGSSWWTASDSLSPASAQRIGQVLNGDVLVLGAYTTVGTGKAESLRLDYRLQSAQSGAIQYEGSASGPAEQMFGLVESAGAALRRQMGLSAAPASAQADVLAVLPTGAEARRFYALGLEHMRDNDVATAKDLLMQAERADATFALTHLMLARAWGALGYDQNARLEALRALDRAGSLPQADRLLVRASYFDAQHDPEHAAAAYRALYTLYPDNLDYASGLIAALNVVGRREEGLAVVAQLRKLPPPSGDDPRLDYWQAELLSFQHRNAARPYIDRAVAKAAARGQRLLYANFRLAQCLGDIYSDTPDVAPARCQEAYNIFLAAGNRLQAANALRVQADRRGSIGDNDGALELYRRALAMLRPLDEHEKTGAVLNNMAIIEENQGRLAAAARHFEEARRGFVACNDNVNVATALANMGDVALARGELAGAASRFKAALEMGRSFDPASGDYGLERLAEIRLLQADTDAAQRLAQQALAVARARGAAALAQALATAGAVAEVRGDPTGARQDYQRALGLQQKLADAGNIAESQAALAEVSLEQGQAAQAEPALRQALEEARRENELGDELNFETLLARALRLEGREADARQTLGDAARLAAKSQDPSLKLPLAIETARLNRDLRPLGPALRQANALGYGELACEIRLAMAELELGSAPRSARAQLATLEQQARAHGLGRVAQRASLLLHAAPAH